MKSKKLLSELLELVAAYEQTLETDTEPNMDSFITYLSAQHVKPLESDVNTIHQIARQMSLTYRYSRFYIRKAIKGSPMQTEDEYTYLVTLLNTESLTKTELNNLNALEKTTGNEVIRRLLKAGLIEEKPNPYDRRSVRVSITDKGRNELMALFPALRQTAFYLSACLSPADQHTFANIQNQLCTFHNQIFTQKKETPLNELIEEFERGE